MTSTAVYAQTLSLDSCRVAALENNKTVKEAQLHVKESEQIKKAAFTKYFPKVDASASAFKSDKGFIDMEIPQMNLPVYDGNPLNLLNPTEFAYFPGMSVQTLDYTNLAMITAVQPVYAGGKIVNGNKLAKLGTEVSKAKLNLSKEDVILKTDRLYWTLVSLKEKKQTLEGYEKLLNSLLKDVNISYNAGLIEKTDVLKVQLKLNEIEADKLKLNNAVSIVKMSLCQHTGITYTEDFDVSDTVVKIENPEKLFVLPGQALGNRDEYRMLNMAVEAEELKRKMERGEYMPKLAVGVSGMYLDMLDYDNTYGVIFATVTIPLSDWWGGSHKLKEHKIRIEAAKTNLDEKTELMQLQIKKAYMNLTESYNQIQVAELSVKEAKEHLNTITGNYNSGIVAMSDLLEAQAVYIQANDNLTNAKSTYKIRVSEYKRVVGMLNETIMQEQATVYDKNGTK